MTTNVDLTPELERFADQCVAEGRYDNISEVVRSALRLLQDLEQQRRAFTATLDEAMEEGDREGALTLETSAPARKRSSMPIKGDGPKIFAARPPRD